ncbi:MAG: hypothetical protein ABW360_01150 [Phenylobacterium sp.]
MSLSHDLPADEYEVLASALRGPLADRDAVTTRLCLRLCGRRLMQRAGAASVANGWQGSPHAFVLTRDGWALLRDERLRAPIRRTA